MRILSAIQPTGELHIGIYFGALKQWLELQKNNEAFYFVVDLHAMTVPYDTKKFTERTLNAVRGYLALGLDPKKSTIFLQSQVNGHTELAWILSTLTPIGELERMTQYKDKVQKHGKDAANAGLLYYPILMAADILLYKADAVPVGEDQLQHLEFARTIVRKFNNRYGKFFQEPRPIIQKVGAKIMSLADPIKKMSKSDNPDSYIGIFDEPGTIRKKIKKAVTDSGAEIMYNPEQKPAIANLIEIYSLTTGKDFQTIEKEFSGKNYVAFKEALAEELIAYFKPSREKYVKISNEDVIKILADGGARAQKIASENLREIKKVVGIL